MQRTSLDKTYFTTVCEEQHGNMKYIIVKPNESTYPMILFSQVDGSPLAALTLQCQRNRYQNETIGNRGNALITKRPHNSAFKCDFQGIIDRDSQEFELVITNLNSNGMINFNILKTDAQVKIINPRGVNEINELRPYESYAVKCDQSDNGVLILNSIKKETSTSKEEKLTVGEAEEKKESVPKGTYFFLSVVPQLGKPELERRFESTKWGCVDIFCLKKQMGSKYVAKGGTRESTFFAAPPSSYSSAHTSLNTNLFWGDDGSESSDSDVFDGEAEELESHIAPTKAKGESWAMDEDRRLEEEEEESEESEEEESEDCFGFDLFGGMESYTPSSSVSSIQTPSIQTPGDHIYQNSQLNTLMQPYRTSDEHRRRQTRFQPSAYSDAIPSNKLLQSRLQSQQVPQMPQPITTTIIKESYAAKVVSGRKMKVNSMETGIEYNYDRMSEQCVICLSISDKIIFKDGPTEDEMIVLGKEIIGEILKESTKELLNKLTRIYEASKCTICLEDERPLDLVFYQCGHQCTHYECGELLDKCPLCRAYIYAMIKL